MSEHKTGVRLDKWLWAARFYKTRNLARSHIEGGKVQYNGARCKVSKLVEVGATLTLRTGYDTREIKVTALSDQRRGAPEAQQLYEETPASLARREQAAAERRALRAAWSPGDRPTKKQRRQIHQFQRLRDES